MVARALGTVLVGTLMGWLFAPDPSDAAQVLVPHDPPEMAASSGDRRAPR